MSPLNPPRIAATADVDERASIGEGTLVWDLAQIREGATLGEQCIIGRGAFVGPAVVFTNDYFPVL